MNIYENKEQRKKNAYNQEIIITRTLYCVFIEKGYEIAHSLTYSQNFPPCTRNASIIYMYPLRFCKGLQVGIIIFISLRTFSTNLVLEPSLTFPQKFNSFT